MNKSKPVSFRLPEDIKSALEIAAKNDARSVSSMLEKLVTEWLIAKEYLPSAAPKNRA